MNRNTDITVLLATCNRAEILHRTLENMTRVDRSGLTVEFVVVDNNSTDDTRSVIDSLGERLPIRYLFEPRPGKCCALNRALDEIQLGRLVVFTDDDVEPRSDWLTAITAVSQRWPTCSVFGGRIHAVWPEGHIPGWARFPRIQRFAYCVHDCGPTDRPYPKNYYPFGPNYWLRREVLENGRRFDETIGPGQANRTMLDESVFLKQVAADGHEIIYSPDAVVGHFVQPALLSVSGIRRRAFRSGCSGPRAYGLCRQALLESHPTLWRILRVASLGWAVVRYAGAMMSPLGDRRVLRSLDPISDVAYNLESLRLAREIGRTGNLIPMPASPGDCG